MSDFLKTQWDKMIAALDHSGELGQERSNALFAKLMARYSEPHRRYHTVQHIEECFKEYLAMCNSGKLKPADAVAVEFAIFYHDAFYNPEMNNNEGLSADLAGWILVDIGMDPKFAWDVQKHILATKLHGDPTDIDTAIVLDIDLSIFGQSEERFDEYERQIREEYHFVPDADFRETRASILDGFLKRPRIYSTDYFFNKYQLQARQNLQRSVAELDPSLLTE